MTALTKPEDTTVAVTGADGFIGSNLMIRLAEQGYAARPITRRTADADARSALAGSDVVLHLAGTNRPGDPAEFMRSNRDFAAGVAQAVADGGRCPLIIYASSVKVEDDSEYGRSKLAGEAAMLDLADRGLAQVLVHRLPNVFGKWARPNYNSAVATFCHNLARGLPIRIDDPRASLSLLYIDDLADQWIDLISAPGAASGMVASRHVHHSTVGAVADQIRAFAEGRERGEVGPVSGGLARALYATFVSALPSPSFSYSLAAHVDQRGSFTEFVRTANSGQVAFLTAHPGVTRGGHYHHSKVEKFLVVHGEALFRFRHLLTGETHEIRTSASQPVVVETIPGWTHDVTNTGGDVMVALVWANETFDPERPDTVAMPL